MKIFVTVGTHSQQFDRLLEKIDGLKGSGKIKDEIFAQAGNCTYKPKNFKFGNFISDAEYEKWMKSADIIVSHAGAGSIINALKNRKALVIVPRLTRFGEHVNDHQLELAKAMEKESFAISVDDEKNLLNAIEKAHSFRPKESGRKMQTIATLQNFLGKVR